MSDTVVTDQGQQVSVPKEVADFLARDRRRMRAQYKRDQRRLSRRNFETALSSYGDVARVTEDAPPNFHFCTESRILGDGMEEQLRQFLAEHPDMVLVIINTLQMIRGTTYDNTYANDYRDLSALKRLADAHDIAILLSHHLRKEKADDVFNRISGATAISGAVDASFTLVEERRGSGRARLSCIGRDIEYRARQKEIVRKIREGKADYVISLKGNHPALLEDISLYFEHFSGELPSCVTKVKDHGRSERRNDRLLTDLSWLPQRTEWDGLQAVGMVTAAISKNDETTTDTRYFLSSVTDVERFAYAVRKHWAIENQLHWRLDVIFAEDASRARKDMSPLNLNVLRKTALALCKNADFGRRLSIQKKRFAAALNPQRLLDILFA